VSIRDFFQKKILFW